MKSLKSALIAVIIACALVNVASATEFKEKPKRAVNIVFANAVQDPALVAAMYEQLNPSFLNDYQLLYLCKVTHKSTVYRILGSRQQWIEFFPDKWRLMKGRSVTTPHN